MGPAKKSIAALRQVMNMAAGARIDLCEFCGAQLSDNHLHVMVLSNRQLACACSACAVLLSGQGTTKYRRVPQRALHLRDFRLTDTQWESLMIPINLAFFFYSTTAGKIVALYPSPAGATECALELAAWNEIERENFVLKKMQPDVEGLLVDRIGNAPEYYLVSIDECYKLVGLVRTHWRGFSGGAAVWRQIDEFFGALKKRAGALAETHGA
ncbi:MAG: DUF5947 family protein [Candidatus Binatia bacterium]